MHSILTTASKNPRMVYQEFVSRFPLESAWADTNLTSSVAILGRDLTTNDLDSEDVVSNFVHGLLVALPHTANLAKLYQEDA